MNDEHPKPVVLENGTEIRFFESSQNPTGIYLEGVWPTGETADFSFFSDHDPIVKHFKRDEESEAKWAIAAVAATRFLIEHLNGQSRATPKE